MKKWLIIVMAVVLVVLAVFFVRFIIGGNEDDWIKDSRGMWIKHGNPASIPAEVREQQDAVSCAQSLYEEAKNSGMRFSSQCLGTCSSYSVDIVHVPRTSEDNLVENQCSDYREGRTSKFIELDSSGEIARVFE
jgi:hypothetical protein